MLSPQQAHFISVDLLGTQQEGQSQLPVVEDVVEEAAKRLEEAAPITVDGLEMEEAIIELAIVLGGELFLGSSFDVSLDVFSADELVSEVLSVVFVLVVRSSLCPLSFSSSPPLPESLSDDPDSSDSDSSLDSDSSMLSTTFIGFLNEKDGFTSLPRNPVVGRANTI